MKRAATSAARVTLEDSAENVAMAVVVSVANDAAGRREVTGSHSTNLSNVVTVDAGMIAEAPGANDAIGGAFAAAMIAIAVRVLKLPPW